MFSRFFFFLTVAACQCRAPYLAWWAPLAFVLADHLRSLARLQVFSNIFQYCRRGALRQTVVVFWKGSILNLLQVKLQTQRLEKGKNSRSED